MSPKSRMTGAKIAARADRSLRRRLARAAGRVRPLGHGPNDRRSTRGAFRRHGHPNGPSQHSVRRTPCFGASAAAPLCTQPAGDLLDRDAQATQCRSTATQVHLARDAPALPTSRQVPLTIVRTAGLQAIRERIGRRRDLFCGAEHRVEYLGLGAAFATYVDPLRT
jgi:hypothetical protein